ncbi:MAG: hypothetical protein MUO91_10300 [candidate division Zixibacteria bacterium]|nr:hypothetical protein [candidate division Zixibacteria bacterium]
MKMKKKSWTLLAVAIFATLLLSGCWLFGITLVLNYDIENEIASTDTHFNSVLVDLTQEQDWKDNQDKLDEIYILYFYGWIQNYESTPATGQLYVYKDTTLQTIAEVESLATLVLDGLVIPADSTVEVPLTAMKLEPIRDLIMKGKFALYAIATDVPFHIRVYDATVVVVFAVETIF